MPNVSLGAHFEQFIEAKIKQGRFQNASEVVRAGLRLLEDDELQRTERAAALARAINSSLDDPRPDVPAAKAFERIERRYKSDMKAKRADA